MENHHTELVDRSSQDTTFFPNDQWAYRLVASINQQLPNSQVKPPALVCYMVLFVSLTDHGNRTAGAHRHLSSAGFRPSRHCAGIELPRPARHSHATSQSCHLHLAGSPAATSSSAPTRQLPTAHSFHNALVPAASGARSAYRHGVGARAPQVAAPGRAAARRGPSRLLILRRPT